MVLGIGKPLKPEELAKFKAAMVRDYPEVWAHIEAMHFQLRFFNFVEIAEMKEALKGLRPWLEAAADDKRFPVGPEFRAAALKALATLPQKSCNIELHDKRGKDRGGP